MKKTAVVLSVVALAVVVLGGPALAQNRNNTVNMVTANSAFFGFLPTPAQIHTFMQADASSTFVNGQFNTYVKNNQAPGAYTARPDKAVSANPDFGCGTQVATYADCVEAVLNIEDRVNGNTTSQNIGQGGTVGNGQNTAPTSNGFTGGGGPSGVLVGNMDSQVFLDSLEDGMPSGSITFHRIDNGIDPISATFDQTVASTFTNVGGGAPANFQEFSEHDYTLAPFTLITGVQPCLVVPAGTPNTPPGCMGAGVMSAADMARYPNRTSGAAGGFPHSNLQIRTVLDLTQASLGGEGSVTEHIGYTVDWQGNGTYPGVGNYFTPGLNVDDWIGSSVVDNNGL